MIDSGAKLAIRVAYGGATYIDPSADTGGICWWPESHPPPSGDVFDATHR